MAGKSWNLQNITEAALTCRTRSEFNNQYPGAVARAKKLSVYEQVTAHMVNGYMLAWKEGRQVQQLRPEYVPPAVKACIQCLRLQDIDNFYVHNGRHRGACIGCSKARAKAASGKAYRQYKKDCCEECDFVAVDPCQLDVDHIDGDHSNNEITNLRTLCANCHRLKTQLNREWPSETRRKLRAQA